MSNKLFSASLGTILLISNVTAHSTTTPVCWKGAYVGGFAGGATKSNVTTSEPLRLDNNAYWFRPFHQSFSHHTSASFIGGATIGYNWQISTTPAIVGLEAEYGYLKLNGSGEDPNQIPYAVLPNNNLVNSSRNVINIGNSFGYGLIGGRLGYAKDRVLVYFKTGAVFTNIQSKYKSVKTEDLSLAYLNLSAAKKVTGYGIGGGIEYALPFPCFTNVSAKIEYLFFAINKKQRTYGDCSCHFLWRTIEHVHGFSTFKIGLNYKFA